MKAGNEKVVAVSYELEVEGKIADKSPENKPLEYIHGMGMLLPKFEANILDKEPGDAFEFVLSPEEGYGVADPKLKIDLPKSSFTGADGKVMEDLLTIGRIIPMYDNNGRVVQGTVIAVSAEKVTMDFNHPMAGKTLHFTGKVVSVRQATEKELTEGLHGEFLPQEEHCGGCGGCGGGHCEGEGECEGECGCGHEGKRQEEGKCKCKNKK